MRHNKNDKNIEKANSCSPNSKVKRYHLHQVRTLPFYVKNCQSAPFLLIQAATYLELQSWQLVKTKKHDITPFSNQAFQLSIYHTQIFKCF